MKTYRITIIFFLILIKSNLLYSQSDFNEIMKGMIISSIHSDTVNLTAIDEYSLPCIDTAIIKKYELIILDGTDEYQVKDISEAYCRFIDFHERNNFNLLVLLYSPSMAGNGSPTLQITTTDKKDKVISRLRLPYYYPIDPGYEAVQTLIINSETSFSFITKEINRELKNDEFVLKNTETKQEEYTIENGVIRKKS